MFYCFVNLSVYMLFYIKCFEITIASTTANFACNLWTGHLIFSTSTMLCLSFLNDKVRGLMTFRLKIFLILKHWV